MDIILDSLYVGLIAFIYYYLYITPHINKMNNKIKNLEYKQEILYKAIIKLRNIANIDTELRNAETEDITKINNFLKIISKETGIKYLDNKSQQTDHTDENETNEEDKEDEDITTDSTPSPKNNPVLPIQNHIKFPPFRIFNDSKFKKYTLSKPNIYSYQMIANDVRLLSSQLSSFLKYKDGTCLEFNKAYDEVLNYINDNNITALNEDHKLRNLFGISEDEDYEYSYSDLVNVLKKLLEPHLKKINYCN